MFTETEARFEVGILKEENRKETEVKIRIMFSETKQSSYTQVLGVPH